MVQVKFNTREVIRQKRARTVIDNLKKTWLNQNLVNKVNVIDWLTESAL